jgi:hypothetical protein
MVICRRSSLYLAGSHDGMIGCADIRTTNPTPMTGRK